MWKLKNPADAKAFKVRLGTCSALSSDIRGMLEFEVAIKTDALEASCDVALYSVCSSKQSLDAYQAHPHHLAVSAQLEPLRDTRSVLNYEVNP